MIFPCVTQSDLRALLQALTIDSSSNIRVKGLTIQNSQQMHFTIARSQTVRITEVRVSSPGDSPNTDGIHITQSTNVVVQNCKISTGFHSDPHHIIFSFTTTISPSRLSEEGIDC